MPPSEQPVRNGDPSPGNWVGVLAILFLLSLQVYWIASRGHASSLGWTSVELVSIVLTAVTIILAALGLGIALFTVYGYQQLQEAVKRSAEAAAGTQANVTATKVANERIDSYIDSPDLDEKLRKVIATNNPKGAPARKMKSGSTQKGESDDIPDRPKK